MTTMHIAIKPPASAEACQLLERFCSACENHARTAEALVQSATNPHTKLADINTLRRRSMWALESKIAAERALLDYMARVERGR